VEPTRLYSGMKWILGTTAFLFAALLGLLLLILIGSSIGAIPLYFGMVLAMLPVPFYLALVLWIDRYEKEPLTMLAGAFVWGATVATLFSYLTNSSYSAIIGSLVSPAAGEVFSSVVSAPIAEESSKALALFSLYFWKRDEFDGVIDGIVYAAMVGLGFATVENVLYYGVAVLEGGAVDSLITFIVRGVLSPFNHPILTSMTGIGLGLAIESNKTYIKFVAPALGLLLAILAHSVWNLWALLPLGWIVVLLFLEVPLAVGILAVVLVSLGREGRIIRYYLSPELETGLLSYEEYESLCTVRGRLEDSFKALINGGFKAWLFRGRFQQAASELAFLRDRVARGEIIYDQTTVDREVAYIQLLRDLKLRMTGQ
jgi:RsiW-degrading membrane proteinase PrsW (M82 family)